MTLTQLRAFVMAASLGTFTAAATELQMSQPAVSDLIRRLEHELSAQLFYRGARSLVLTSAGEQLFTHAKQSVHSADEGQRAVRSQLSLGGGIATFGLLRNADFYLKTDLAARFRAKYPNVRIRLIGQNSAETAVHVSTGVLEAGLVTLPIEEEGLEIVPLARDEVIYVTADEDRAKQPRTIEQFCNSPLVLYDAHFASNDPARRQLNDRAQLAGNNVEPEIEVEFLSTAMSLVSEGYADSIVCRAAISTVVGPGLHTVPFEDPLYDTLALIKRRGAALSPATREIARMAVDSLVQHQESPAGTADLLLSPRRLAAFFSAQF